jgi:sortase A
MTTDVTKRRPKLRGLRPSGRRRAKPAPRPPRRPPPSATPPIKLTSGELLVRSSLTVLAVLLLAFVLDVSVLSQLQHLVSQQQLSNVLRDELAAGTAPVSEGNFDDVLLADGDPVAVLTIPQIGVSEVVVEGTSASELKGGPGHRRDTVLPGQIGTSVVMARAAAFGGPFSKIQELAPDDRFTVRTGQGLQTFAVMGVRYSGDPAPVAPTSSQSRLILVTARGAPFVPTGVAYVDAQLVSTPKPAGHRQTTSATLPAEDLALATDPSTMWALVFALQLLLIVEVAGVWTFTRIGPQKTWIVFAPISILAALIVGNQVALLLPNLL